MSSKPKLRIVLVTVPDRKTGEIIATELVKARLAGCVNILSDIRSVYWWKGEVHSEAEVLLIVKTEADKIEDLETKLLALHPYDTPEYIVLNPEFVNEKYAHWLTSAIGE